MAAKGMKDLMVEELRDIYHAEKQLTKALPKLAKAASHDQLRQAFEQHLEETKGHVERLEQIFDELDVRARGRRCEAMEGLIEEARQIMEEVEPAPVLDAGLIAAAQKVEHYEIASYGTIHAYAEALGMQTVADLVGKTLEEEKQADAKLTQLAVGEVNKRALQPDQAA